MRLTAAMVLIGFIRPLHILSGVDGVTQYLTEPGQKRCGHPFPTQDADAIPKAWQRPQPIRVLKSAPFYCIANLARLLIIKINSYPHLVTRKI